MRQGGWSCWLPHIEGQAPASVAAALYYLTGIDHPIVLLPMHGVLYAMSAATGLFIARALGVTGKTTWIALAPFYLFPSAAIIWGQIHKDIYTLPSTLLVLRFWIWLWSSSSRGQAPDSARVIIELLLLSLSMMLILFVRPYLGQVTVLASIFAASVCGASYFRERDKGERAWLLALTIACGLFVQASVVKFFYWSDATSETEERFSNAEQSSPKRTLGQWEHSTNLAFIEIRLKGIAEARNEYIRGYGNAGSNLDVDVRFFRLHDMLLYIPRASQIAILAPFPDQWLGDAKQPGGGIMRKVVMLEMLLFYACIPGLLLALLMPRTRVFAVITTGFMFVLALSYAFAVVNMGTLYRMRYPAQLAWMVVGIAGWQELARRWRDTILLNLHLRRMQHNVRRSALASHLSRKGECIQKKDKGGVEPLINRPD
ncbi:MAG TPA: hypothetical protein PKD55_20485 [Bellilinea sp.]|nr:hypothetical protein [Bellilinea sp.]